ncbi:MAG: hypothetical protein H6700_12070 [Myxococcales bacterium]|nr:hypothetical protein [Myxococcales bacterium]
MPYTTVIVQHKSGTPASGVRVVLSFGSFSGQTKPVLTDRDGRALIEHSHTGSATVYVDGRDRGSVRTPGSAAFTI